VESGCVCTFSSGAEGQRLVSGFHLSADIFGLECAGVHRSSAEAVSHCHLVQCERKRLGQRLEEDPEFAARAWPFVLAQQDAIARRLLFISHADGVLRLMLFLEDLSERTGQGGHVELPMSRYDIADYLGLSSETVSRIFTKLKRARVIALERGAVTLLAHRERRRLAN
jgi:CRP-like cAMP-binding protein